MVLFSRNSPFSRVTALAELRPVHAAFAWLHGNPKKIMDWQAQLVAIPAPPFGEQARGEWLAARFVEAGLKLVEADEVGNIFGVLPATDLPPESTGPVVVLSAHLDTVFPANTPLNPVVDGDRLEAPGACDNGAGLVGMLAIAHALVQSKAELAAPLVFLGNVGEGRGSDAEAVEVAAPVGLHVVDDLSAGLLETGKALAHGGHALDGDGDGPGRHPGDELLEYREGLLDLLDADRGAGHAVTGGFHRRLEGYFAVGGVAVSARVVIVAARPEHGADRAEVVGPLLGEHAHAFESVPHRVVLEHHAGESDHVVAGRLEGLHAALEGVVGGVLAHAAHYA